MGPVSGQLAFDDTISFVVFGHSDLGGKTIVIEEIEDSQSKKGKQLRLRIPTPPNPPSLLHGFHGKPVTTLILTFKRSQLEGKKGADWEALLAAAEGCGILNRKGTSLSNFRIAPLRYCSSEDGKSDIHEHRNEVYNDQGTLHEFGLQAGKRDRSTPQL